MTYISSSGFKTNGSSDDRVALLLRNVARSKSDRKSFVIDKDYHISSSMSPFLSSTFHSNNLNKRWFLTFLPLPLALLLFLVDVVVAKSAQLAASSSGDLGKRES